MSVRHLRAVGQLGLVVGLLLLPPLLLASVVGSPLPAGPVSVDAIIEASTTGAIPDTFWTALLAAVGWMLWGALVLLLVVELLAVVRDRPSVTWMPALVRSLAQRIVAATLVLSSSPMSTAAVALPPPAVAVSSEAIANTTASEDAGPTIRVSQDDSWSNWATEVLGEAELGAVVRQHNIGRDVGGTVLDGSEPWVEAGWTLALPTGVDAAGGPESATADDAAGEPAPEDPPPATVEVEAGDSLWQIAADELGDGHAWTAIWDRNDGSTMADGTTFTDPDLIHPGWSLQMPDHNNGEEPAPGLDSGADRVRAIDDGRRPEPVGTSTQEPPVPTEEAEDVLGPPTSAPRVHDARTAVSAHDGWATLMAPPGPSTTSDDVVELANADDATEPDDGLAGDDERITAWGTRDLTAGLAAALLGSAGLVEVLRRRRRRAAATRSSGLRLPTPAPDTVEAVDRLRAAAPDDEPREELASLLRTLPLNVSPMLVWWDDHGVVTIAFEEAPAGNAPTPWTGRTVGGRVVWTASIGDQGPERSWGLPLLVTLGRNEGRTIALDLARAQHLALSGPSDLTESRLLAIGAEVATSRLSGPLEVVTTADDWLDGLDRVRVVDALGEPVADSVEEYEGGLLEADRTPRLLLAREGELAPHLPDQVSGLIGTVAIDGRPGWLLRVASREDAVLVMPDDARLPIVLPEIPAELLLDELQRLDQIAPLDSVDELDATPELQGDPVDVPDPHFAEVRILGPVEVVVDGEGLHLAPRTLDVLTYLAIHRDGVPAGRLDEAVWTGAASNDSQRVRSQLAKLRSALGDGPDGEPLLPPRTQQDPRIVLSSAVGTDLDRAMRLVQNGRRADGRARRTAAVAALSLVRGRPFESMDAPEWAAETEHVAIARLQDEAVWLARDARGEGRLDDALWAVERGLALFGLAEQLWAEWLRIAAAADDRDEIRRVMGRARTVLASDADEVTGTALGPSADLEGLYGELLSA